MNEEKSEVPEALLTHKKRMNWVWILPVIAVAASGWILFSHLAHKGVPITVHFLHGHGLKAGDVVKYRGIEVGTVESMELSEGLEKVVAGIALDSSAEELAREGTQFWVVRPQLDFSGPRGLDTMIGANYINVLPGEGEKNTVFDGLEEPPLIVEKEEGSLHVLLMTPMASGIQSGAPVSYRQVPIGSVIRVQLSPDTEGVNLHAVIDPPFRDWIKHNVRFWKTGGASVKAGLFSGITMDVQSMRSLVLGGISVALPPGESEMVEDGHRFELHEEPTEQWLEWTPRRFGQTMDELLGPKKE